MRTLTLGNGVSVPRLGLGVWPLTDAQAYTAVSHALACGYRHFDTARVYDNEAGVGRAIRDAGIPRQDVFLTTKLWNADQGHDAALRAFDTTLQRLGTDYVDLYLIHWPVPEQDLYVESYRALERIHRDGRARAIGVSNFTAATLGRLLNRTDVVPALNQIELHPYFQQNRMREFCARRSITTGAWSPLAQGGALLDEPALLRLAEQHGKTAAQVVIRWHLQLGHVVIPRSVNPSRIEENIDVFDFRLGPEEMRAIAALDDDDGRIGPDPDASGRRG
ncbi:putative oxidoreductase [Streptomyces subrutilus]|uniref:Aldo/keto reductase n=1 Tax=Streptomyces subrutilus TaxID=36818 RepID=A0A5P2UKI7_9ACTN|nr:aldo/keto reductase [Streptomyces subrutilus]QEU77117.1 aldo/keto reductase [Streptomyces subrutilus]GGZ86709.1 putative oxidoreductase [Streptomyces subrutilus]